MSLESHALHCSECSVPVGSDGPQRAALLLPCEHVTHVSCAEFVARKVKYFKRLTSTDAGSVAEMADDGMPGETAFFCPGCGEEVERIVPLYLAHEQPKAANAGVSVQFEKAHEAQRQCLRSLRHLWEVKSKVVELGHRCAALHTRRAAHLRELEQYQLLFSPVAVTDAEAARSAAARTASRIDEMGISELELYLSQSTPALLHSQSALRRERRQLELRKKKLSVLKKQYQTRKELASVNQRIDQVSEGGSGTADAGPCRHDARVHDECDVFPHQGRSLKAMSAYVAAATAEASAGEHRVGQKRRRDHDVVNVDELASGVSAQTPNEVHCLDDKESSCSVEVPPGNRHVHVSRAQFSSPRQPQPEIIDVDESEASGDYAINWDEAAHTAAGAGAITQDRGDDSTFITIDPDDIAETMGDALPVFVPCILSKPSLSASPHPNHVRLLPRREDRLWQPSLQF